MRPLSSLLLLAALGIAVAAPAHAQVRFMPYVGYNLSAGFDLENTFTDEEVESLDTQGGVLVGVGVEFGLTPGILPVALKLRPSVETVFVPSSDLDLSEFGVEGTVEISQSFLQVSADVIAEFSPPAAPIAPYAGVGVTYAAYSIETSFSGDIFEGEGDGETDDGSAFGVNLLGGIRFGGGFAAPFVQARYSIADPTPDEAKDEGFEIGNAFSIMAGVSFGL